jgi:general secretion pathway protein B
MSYILDALKKAEAERTAGASANLHAAPPAANRLPQDGHRTLMRTPWPWVAMTAVAATLAAYSWLRSGPAATSTAAPQAQVPATAPVPASPVASPPVTAKQQAAAIAPSAPPPAPAVAEEEAAPPKARSAKPPAKPAEKKHAPAETKAAEPVAPLPPPLRELPDNIQREIQREIPPLKVGGYIYSASKADRTVIINGRLLHEGEEAAPGLILEKMMPNGMVLNYRGYRYRSGY